MNESSTHVDVAAQLRAYVGDEAQVKRGVLTLRRPMESGLIMDFDGFGKLLHHAFYNELRVDPSEHAVIITSRALAPKSQRERLTQILFEDLGIAALHVENAQCLSLYASGRTTGVVVDIGATGVDVVPLYEGYPLPHAVSSSSSISGMAVTNYLQVILTERGYSFTTTAEREIIQDIKEKFCEAKQQQQQQEQSTPGEGATAVQEKQYELPDGNTVAIGDECFRASEVLFSPLDGSLGLADLVFQTIMKVDVDIRKDLFGNIILAGGGSLLSGLEARLTSELTALAPSTMRIRLIAPPERKFSSWIGGSILASLSTFQPMWLPRSVYEEMGPSCIHGASLEGAKIKKEAKQRSKNKEATAAQKAAAEREAFQTEVDEMMEKALASTAKRAGANGGAEVVATKPLADPNSLVVHCGAWLSSQEQVRDRGGGASAAEQARTTLRCNPFNCAGCEAVLDATTMASASQGDASGSSFVMLESWHCSFCGVCNVIDAAAIGEALGDTSFNIADLDDEINYLLPASCDSVGPAAGSQIDAVAFVVDCSGSMGVTQEVHGEVPFLEKGAAATAPTNSSLIEAGTDRPLSQQRLPREQRNVTHVSRMVCAKAAMMDQINSLTKNDEGVCADLVTFSGSVELIGDGSVTELSIEGGRLNDMNAVRAAAQRFAASSLPSHASTSTGSTNQGAVRDDECAICLEKVDRSTACTLPCSHTFHASCLEKLQKFNRDRWGGEDKVPWNSCCPTCRAKMPSDCGNADAKAGECSAGGSDLASLSACIEKLEESGPTALGPALLCAVELLKARGGVAGGRLVLLTDGLANVGLGNLEDHPETAEGFYSRVGTEAAAAGVAINVVAIDSTAEGTSTKVGLEFLGGLADATGGSVELVSALDLASSALGAGAAAEKTLASRASIVVLVGEPFPLSCPPASEKPRSVQHFTRELGRVTPTTDLALNYQVSAVPAASNHGGEQIVVPIQVQFRYTLPNGEVHVRVRTLRQPVVTDRHLAEQGVDAHVSSVAAIQSAAILAEQGNYEAARILMLSHIRLLQRSMCTVSGQEAYLNFVVTAERLDQFMRQKAEEEALLRNTLLHTNNKPGDQASLAEASKTDGATARRSDRDDDSSSAIFQMKRISLATFRNARTATH